MLKRLILTAALVSLALAGSSARADDQDQRMQRQLRSNFGLVVESSSRGDQDEGFTVLKVLPNSLAERAGFREGDVIRRVGRRTLSEFRDLANALLRRQQGDELVIQVARDGQFRNLHLMARLSDDEEDRDSRDRYGRANDDDSTWQRLERRFRRLEDRLKEMERPGRYGQARSDSEEQPRDMQRLQKRLQDLEQRLEQERRSGQYGRSSSGVTLGAQTRPWRRQSDSRQGGSADEGVMVTAIDLESPAAEAGLRRGDIITRVDDRDVSSSQELRQALQRIGTAQDATLEVLRGSRQMMLNVRLEGGSRYGARDRRYDRLEDRIDQLESRLLELERNR
jgi:S1-C subfamily serine protease